MKKIRNKTFETNSSSTHSLSIGHKLENKYVPKSDDIKIRWINTDDETVLTTLKDKLSYLVSHIANFYKYDVESYDELLEDIKSNYDFIELNDFVIKKYGKRITFPKSYKGDIEDIVNINHQLLGNSLSEILNDIVNTNSCYLDKVLEDGNNIEFGRD